MNNKSQWTVVIAQGLKSGPRRKDWTWDESRITRSTAKRRAPARASKPGPVKTSTRGKTIAEIIAMRKVKPVMTFTPQREPVGSRRNPLPQLTGGQW